MDTTLGTAFIHEDWDTRVGLEVVVHHLKCGVFIKLRFNNFLAKRYQNSKCNVGVKRLGYSTVGDEDF